MCVVVYWVLGLFLFLFQIIYLRGRETERDLRFTDSLPRVQKYQGWGEVKSDFQDSKQIPYEGSNPIP